MPLAPDPGQLPERRVAVHQVRADRGDALRHALHEPYVRGADQIEVAHDGPLCQDPAKPSRSFRGRPDGLGLFLSADAGASGACGTVLIVPLDDLPEWLPAWCLDHLGSGPAGVLFQVHQVSMVFGLRLADGRDVVVKARADDGRASSCVAAQARLAGRGFPCARPLTPVAGVGSLAVHAEEFRPGGEVLHGDSPEGAAARP